MAVLELTVQLAPDLLAKIEEAKAEILTRAGGKLDLIEAALENLPSDVWGLVRCAVAYEKSKSKRMVTSSDITELHVAGGDFDIARSRLRPSDLAAICLALDHIREAVADAAG